MTTATTEPWGQVDALDDGRGFVDRSGDRLLVVRGGDAQRWLGDLMTADIASLRAGSSRRTLLLSPTGRIRADMWIAQTDDDTFVVVQAGDQTEAAIDLLRPFVLSSAVTLRDATGTLSVTFVPAREEILASFGEGQPAAGHNSTPADERAYELWRIAHGDPRMGIDFDAGTLPAESGLERLIDVTKGCFLGQESVAKVRNLGHPPTVLRHLRAEAAMTRGDPIHAPDGVVGRVTSAVPARRGGTVLLARVDWKAAEVDLSTAEGEPLSPRRD
jgi:tRNA-modifying protein YgfZ